MVLEVDPSEPEPSEPEPSEPEPRDPEPNPLFRDEEPKELYGSFKLDPNPLLRVDVPNPLFRLNDDDPGSEKEGKLLSTPPFQEHVPRPELDEYEPLLHIDPALAIEIPSSEKKKTVPAIVTVRFIDAQFLLDPTRNVKDTLH